MKKYNIRVNGSLYQVEVEEITDGHGKDKRRAKTASGPTNVHEAVMTALGPGSDDFGKSASEHGKTDERSAASGGQTNIEAPLPGKVLDVRVSAGQEVKEGDILVILEAMKMENEIQAPVSGTVVSVNAVKGASVSAGDLLAVIR